MAKKKNKALALVKQSPYSGVVLTDEIKRRRLALGITMAEASRLAGWKTLQTWSGIERGMRPDPQVSTLVRVAKVLGCKVDQLLRKP